MGLAQGDQLMTTRGVIFAAAMLAAAWTGIGVAAAAGGEFYSSTEVLKWMNSYRS